MITYVNTVLVGKGASAIVSTDTELVHESKNLTNAGKYVIMDIDNGKLLTADTANTANRIKIGIIRPENTAIHLSDGTVKYHDVIKWSNIISKDSIISINSLKYGAEKNAEEKVTVDFSKVNTQVMADFAKGGKRIVLRITYKDLPTRYRKWTESYEYITAPEDTADTIAESFAAQINGQYKRARVTASAASGVLTLTAMPYTDDDSNDSINWAETVRFSVNCYFTDPTAAAFASKNKYAILGLEIEKTPGKRYAADAKLVRDREANAMGYEGILNKGCCTWPIIKPAMQVDITKNYDAITLEFERMYRAADDIFRKTKESIEIYDVTGSLTDVAEAIKNFSGMTIAGDDLTA